MGASGSRIWTEICAIESNHVRAQMIERLVASPDILISASRVGVYEPVMEWLLAYRRGEMRHFPFRSGQDTIQHDTGSSQQVIISPAAKALDYFQQCLALLSIDENDALTYDRLKKGYKRASLMAHPDKGGSKEAFDEVSRAFQYVEKILQRINPKFSAADEARMSGQVTLESATAWRASSAPQIADEPVALSAKKLDVSTFNKLFEQNRLPDPTRDRGYGDWLKSEGGSDEIAVDARLKGKFTPQNFEAAFRDKVAQNTTTIQRRLVPDAIMSTGGTELGGDATNFTAAVGADVQFTDLQEAYTTGATVYQEVADVRVSGRGARSVDEAKRMREQEMKRVDPDEASRIATAAAALEERERQRRLRLAQQDTAAESWSDMMRRRLLVNN